MENKTANQSATSGTTISSGSAASNAAPIAPGLAAAAAAIDQEQLASSAPPPVPGFASQLEPITDLCGFTIGALTPLYPSLPKVYTPDVLARLAKALDKLFIKYEISCEALGPELNLAIIVSGLIVPTYEALKHDAAARRAQQQQTAATPAPATPAPIVDAADALHKKA